jgi:hypothetical protein
VHSFDDLGSSNLWNSSSPPEFELPSPISDSSSLNIEDRFDDQNSFIDPWVIPTAFENNTNTPAASFNSPSEENHHTISTPSLASSPGSSSETNSSRHVERDDVETKKPTTTRVGKRHQSEKSRARSPICKSQNAHNLIEKRYRNKLNTKINALRDSIPSLRSATKGDEEGGEDGMDSDADERRKGQKCNKVNIFHPSPSQWVPQRTICSLSFTYMALLKQILNYMLI